MRFVFYRSDVVRALGVQCDLEYRSLMSFMVQGLCVALALGVRPGLGPLHFKHGGVCGGLMHFRFEDLGAKLGFGSTLGFTMKVWKGLLKLVLPRRWTQTLHPTRLITAGT